MRLVCPYVPYDPEGGFLGQHPGLEERTREWVIAHGGELAVVSDGEEAYWRLLCDLWHGGESFIVVEHDMLPTAASYRSLCRCRKGDWCLCPYRVNGTADAALGCTRFSARLLHRFPDALERIPPGDRHWVALDRHLARVLVQELGQPGPHIHRDHEVEHLHRY